jgi:hypothetical protein
MIWNEEQKGYGNKVGKEATDIKGGKKGKGGKSKSGVWWHPLQMRLQSGTRHHHKPPHCEVLTSFIDA